jgi:glycerol-3-phosphate dehydrogenase (NAD(P)+)
MGTEKIAIVGAGSWGTALAFVLAHKGLTVNLWVYEPELIQEIRSTRINSIYLPDIILPESINVDSSFKDILKDVHFIIWVTPSHTIRTVLQEAKAYIEPDSIFVGASKGIESETLMRVSQIVSDVINNTPTIRYVTLSGPTFAWEVARFHPTAAVVAGQDHEATSMTQKILNTNAFRIYTNPDHTGVELGGALKNVIAIATGIAAGLNLGSNTRAALITRGLWEITRLSHAMGASPMTFLGLAGMGDLVLTCDGTQSRNFKVGYRIGAGESLKQIQSTMRMVAEGVRTTVAVRELAYKYNVEMPITEQIYQVLYHEKTPKQALEALMSRSLKREHQLDDITYAIDRIEEDNF